MSWRLLGLIFIKIQMFNVHVSDFLPLCRCRSRCRSRNYSSMYPAIFTPRSHHFFPSKYTSCPSCLICFQWSLKHSTTSAQSVHSSHTRFSTNPVNTKQQIRQTEENILFLLMLERREPACRWVVRDSRCPSFQFITFLFIDPSAFFPFTGHFQHAFCCPRFIRSFIRLINGERVLRAPGDTHSGMM